MVIIGPCGHYLLATGTSRMKVLLGMRGGSELDPDEILAFAWVGDRGAVCGWF
jgi:hypothetical protein